MYMRLRSIATPKSSSCLPTRDRCLLGRMDGCLTSFCGSRQRPTDITLQHTVLPGQELSCASSLLRAAQPRIPARRSSASPRTTLHLSTTCRPYAKPLRAGLQPIGRRWIRAATRCSTSRRCAGPPAPCATPSTQAPISRQRTVPAGLHSRRPLTIAAASPRARFLTRGRRRTLPARQRLHCERRRSRLSARCPTSRCA